MLAIQFRIRRIGMFLGLPDLDPLVRCTIRIRLQILPFSHKGGYNACKIKFNTKFYQKIKFLRLKIMCLRVSYQKKIRKKLKKFASLKSLKKGVGSWSGSVSQRYGSGSAPKFNGTPTLLIGEYCTRRREEQGRLSPGFQPQHALHRSQDCAHWGRGAQVSTWLHRSLTISTLFKE